MRWISTKPIFAVCAHADEQNKTVIATTSEYLTQTSENELQKWEWQFLQG
jgi:hypothetical protein